MRLLITGSKGLIGSALRKACTHLNIQTVGIDKNEQIDQPDYGTILDRNAIFNRMQECDGIIHLAAISRVIFGEKFPKLCWETNVEGTENVLEAALASEKKPWVLYASSREVYGEQKILPVQETAPLAPVNIYGESKAEAERKVEASSLITGIVRFSNVFGSAHDHHDRVIPAFCRASAEGTEIRVDGAENLFDFTFIEDVVHGILAFIYLLSQKNASITPIHLTSGQPATLGEVAHIAKRASHYPLSIRESASRSFDVARFSGDISRAQKLLHWKATTYVKEGMHRLINQYRLLGYGAHDTIGKN